MGAPVNIIGRSAELAALQGLLDDLVVGRGRGIALRGPGGIGKSALLDHLAGLGPPGVSVLRTCGVPGEADIAFSGLADLLDPVVEHLDALPPVQAAALAGALAIGPPRAGDRLAVCVATVGLLRIAAREAPLLAIVDDAQWLDAPSLECVRYAARRTGGRVAFAVAERLDGSARVDPLGERPESVDFLVVPALGLADSLEVLAGVTADLSPGVARALARAADGNPLALVELPATLTRSQRNGGATLPTPIMPGRRLQAVFSARVEALPPAARRALLICALHQGEGIADPSAACRRAGTDFGELAAAETNGLVRLDGKRVSFSHPLLRGAVVSAAGPDERRSAHRALAEALDGDRRAWHLAAATIGPDDAVADALEHAALDAVGRRGYASAASAFDRAARLSTVREVAARRLLSAARAAAGAGQPRWALALLDGDSRSGANDPIRADMEHLRGVCLLWAGRVHQAAEVLTAEGERLLALDPALSAAVFADAATARAATMEYLLAEALAEQAEQQATESDDLVRAHVLAVFGWVHTLRGRTKEAIEALDEAERLSRAVDPLSPEGQWMNFLLRSHIPTGRLHRALQESTALSSRARDTGALAVLGSTLVVRADAALRLGDWTAADEATQEAVEVCRDVGQAIWLGYALTYRARLLAARGEEQESEAAARAAIVLADTAGIRAGMRFGRAALGFLWLSMERIPEAICELEAVDRLLAGTGVEDFTGALWAPDLLEAYVRSGRETEAHQVLDLITRQAADGPATARGLLARCRGVLATDFDTDFDMAMACDDECPMPFERSRTLLSYGRRLRRAGRRVQARTMLAEAIDGFARLGAKTWREQAAREMVSAGGAPGTSVGSGVRTDRAATGTASLTPQEHRVAEAVARGASNREIATMLFLSPKTVESHLTHIHRKLRVNSRAQLVALLVREEN